MSNTKKRDSFVFYRSFYNALKHLDDKQKVELIESICLYGLDKKKSTFSEPICETMFKLIQPLLDANYKKWEAACKGGAPKRNQNAKKSNKESEREIT